MLLIQKATAFPTTSLHGNVHRRHPSAPSPVVQPTRTPGLLTLSKPLQQQQQPHPRQRQLPRSKQTPQKSAARSQQQENVAALKPSPEIVDKKSAATTPADKSQARGRQQAKSKDKPTTRSNSHSAVRGRRNNARQPSPPLPAPTSQAEASSPPHKFSSSNLFDPFLDDSTPPARSKPVRPAPTLASRPSGKLARRRQPELGPSNVPSTSPATSPAKAIPVPRRNNSSNHILSRSAPGPNHLHHRSTVKASSSGPDVFPICDDVSEAGDFCDSEAPVTPPHTPTPSGRAARLVHGFDDGPRTAPITATTKSFPFNSGSPIPTKKGRRHARVPSEGVFAMSSDEEMSTGSVGDAELRALFAKLPRRRPTVSLTDEEKERAAAAAAAAYFASSNFQNSPSPEELPPPSFV